ncbi:hypothetical protein ACJX0J_023169 [Zea mays]
MRPCYTLYLKFLFGHATAMCTNASFHAQVGVYLTGEEEGGDPAGFGWCGQCSFATPELINYLIYFIVIKGCCLWYTCDLVIIDSFGRLNLSWIRWALSMFLLDLKRLSDMATAVNNKGHDVCCAILCHNNSLARLQIYRLYLPSILATMQLPLLFYNFIAIFFYFICSIFGHFIQLDSFIFVSVAQCSIFGPVNYISKWFIQLDSFMFSVGSL